MKPKRTTRYWVAAFLILATAAPVLVEFLSTPRPHLIAREAFDVGVENGLGGIERQGRVTGWKLDKDGRLYFRLEGKHRKAPFKLWFQTPPSQTATTHFERLVLQVVLELCPPGGTGRDSGPEITVQGDDSNDKGSSPDDALELSSIRHS